MAAAGDVKPVDAKPAAAEPVDAKPADVPRSPAVQTARNAGPAEAAQPPTSPPPTVSKIADLPADLLEKTRKATVYIGVTSGNRAASGSGFIVRSTEETAYIVTNYHVIAAEADAPKAEPPQVGPPGLLLRPPGMPRRLPGFPTRPPGFPARPGFGPIGPRSNNTPESKTKPPNIEVMLYRGTPQESTFKADVAAEDEDLDLAVLRITGGRNLPAPISLADEAGLEENMPIRIFGFPGGKREMYIGAGKVSQLTRNERNELKAVQINGQLNPGNSGGPVVDMSGRLVGVATSTVKDMNVGFAVPTTHLAHMFKGAIHGGIVCRPVQKGLDVAIVGEAWRFDRKNHVEDRSAVDLVVDRNAPRQRFPADEYLAIAMLSDPMQRIKSATLHYCVNKPDSVLKDGAGWASLRNAASLEMTLKDRSATATVKLPAGAADEIYAVQFSYVNADEKSVYTEPHLVRFSFPKSLKTLSLTVTGVNDEASKRAIEDSIRALVPSGTVTTFHLPNGVQAVIDPVDDPKAFADQIKFGAATVSGWRITVTNPKVDLKPPSAEEVDKAVTELNSADKNVRNAAADRLAKCYAIRPERREEAAKALETIVVTSDKDNDWVGKAAALKALKMWSGPENVAGLVAYLEKSDVNKPQGDMIAIIAVYNDPAAAKVLASCLPSGFNRGPAEAALKAIGPKAEKAVIPMLEHKDGWTARSACGILKEIGTKESNAPLQALIDKKGDPFTPNAAKDALQAIQKRE
jgi:S1-C subfamily serine protease